MPQTEAAKSGPAIVLVRSQLGENIGTAARAMLNCGLTDLRLVQPRDWPSERAYVAASGADAVLAGAKVFASLKDAIGDLRHVYASTARNRYMAKSVVTVEEGARDMVARVAGAAGIGVVFGPERTGLENDEIALCDTLVNVPLNPGFSSLNLAQAVLLVGYEWLRARGMPFPPKQRPAGRHGQLASKAEQVAFFERLEAELDACGFLRIAHMRPTMVRNIRNMFERAELTEQEIRTLHGIVTCLITGGVGPDGSSPVRRAPVLGNAPRTKRKSSR